MKKLETVVTFVSLSSSPSGTETSAVQLVKRPETSVTSVRLSNRPAGISVTFLQPLNAEASEAIFGQLSKKPSGMDVNDEQPEKSEAGGGQLRTLVDQTDGNRRKQRTVIEHIFHGGHLGESARIGSATCVSPLLL